MHKFFFHSFIFLTISTFCFSAADIPSINDMMSVEDQRRTGVIRLKQNQKMELAKWLVAHGFYERHEKAPGTGEHTLSITRNIGTELTLSDGSEWEVAPEDVKTAKRWGREGSIIIRKVKNPLYPYQLINVDIKGNEFIKARFPFT